MEGIPRNTPALLGTDTEAGMESNLTICTARIDQLRNSLIKRFENLIELSTVELPILSCPTWASDWASD